MDQICYQAHQRISISIEFTSQTHRRSHKNTSLKGDATPFTPNEGPVGPSQNVHQRGDTHSWTWRHVHLVARRLTRDDASILMRPSPARRLLCWVRRQSGVEKSIKPTLLVSID